jgi:hypothetical protein
VFRRAVLRRRLAAIGSSPRYLLLAVR